MQKKTAAFEKLKNLLKSNFNRRHFARIVPALLFLFAIPAKAEARFLGEGLARAIVWGVLYLVSKLLWIAQGIFTYSLTITTNFSDKLPAIEEGWKVARDATNIFFIIILLFMAIGTILRIQGYAAKQLLVKLVLMAVLINFSLAIGSVVVDFSNVLGIQFLTAIDKDFKVSDVIMGHLALTKMFEVNPTNPDKELGDFSTYMVVVLGNAVLMMVLMFVFFVSGLLMFTRLAVLIFLLVISPIAFLFYILPETQKHWSKWWDALIQYSFFFPAFAFLLYISIRMIIVMNKIAGAQAGYGTDPKLLAGNFIDNQALIVGYFIACAFLLSSIIMGKQMGIAGSNAVIGWAKTGRKYVTGALASGALYPVRGITQRIAGTEAVQRLKDRLQASRIPGRVTLSRGIDAMLQRGAVVGQMRPKSAEQTADFLAKQDNNSILKAWGGLSYMQKMAVLRKLPKDRRDKLMELLPEDQKQLALRMSRGFEGEGRAGELETAEWQRIKASSDPNAHENSMRHFANMSRAGKERALRTMDQKEQADYIGKLRAAKLTDAADQSEDIIRTEFTQQQRAAYDVAGFQRLSAEEQFSRIGGLSNQAASAFLFAKSPEERKAFIDALDQRAQSATTPEEKKRYEDEKDRMNKVVAEYFTPEDLRKHRVTLFNTEKDPVKIAAAWGELTVPEQEEVMRTRNDQQQSALVNVLDKAVQDGALDPRESARAKQIMKDILTPAQLAKYMATQFLRQPQADQNEKFGDDQVVGDGDALVADLAREEIIRRKKTANEQAAYVASLNQAGKDAAGRVIETTLAPHEIADYKAARIHLLPPDEQATAFDAADETVEEAFVRSLSGERRAGFLKTLDVAQRSKANSVIKARFSVDEQSEIIAEEFFFETEDDKKRELFKNADTLAKEKILAKFKEDGDRERFVSGMELSGKADLEKLAAEARKIQFSTRFTATQNTNMKKAFYANYATLAENAGTLTQDFYVPGMSAKENALWLENMSERQQTEIFEAAKKDAAVMEQLYDVVHSMKPHLRDQYLTKIISRGSAGTIENYFAFTDSKIGEANGRGDTQREQELIAEKGRIFQSLAPEAKARLWVSAWQNQANDNGRSFGHITTFVDKLSDSDKQNYHESFASVLGEINHTDPEKAWGIFTELEPQTRTTMLQSRSGKGAKVVLAIQDRYYEQLVKTNPDAAETVASRTQQEFTKAGVGNYKKPKPSGGGSSDDDDKSGGGTRGGGTHGPTTSPAGAAMQREDGEQARRERVSDVNEQVRRTVSAATLDDMAVNETIKNIKLIEKEKLSPEGRKEFLINAGLLAKRLYVEGKSDQAVEISKTLYGIEGAPESDIRASGHTEEHINAQTGKRELWHPQTRTFYGEREDGRFEAGSSGGLPPDMFKTAPQAQPTFRGGPVETETPRAAQQTPLEARPRTGQAARQTQATGPAESRARGGGSAQLNQEALRQARERSGGGGEVAISPAVKKVMSQQPAQAAVEYTKLNPQERIEVLRVAPQKIIEMRNEAPADAQAQIINDIKSSAPARRFESAQGTQGRVNTLLSMPPQEQKIVLEAVVDNPLQLTHLRSAVQQLKPEQQKQFYKNILAEASEPARQQYAQHIRAEKERAVRDNRASDVERLTREEQVITSKRPLASPPQPNRTPSDSPQGGATLGVLPTAPPRPEAPRHAPQATQVGGRAQVDAIKPNGKQQTPRSQPNQEAAIPMPPSFTSTTTPQTGKIVEGAEAVTSKGVGAQEEKILTSAIDTFKEKLRAARSKEALDALLKEITAYLNGLQLLRQEQQERGLAETSFEVQNTDRFITEAELLIEEIKKQLAKFSS